MRPARNASRPAITACFMAVAIRTGSRASAKCDLILDLSGGAPLFSGGKRDFTIKWWDRQRYQQVVDHFRDRIQFVQVGDASHYHPPLDGVIGR